MYANNITQIEECTCMLACFGYKFILSKDRNKKKENVHVTCSYKDNQILVSEIILRGYVVFCSLFLHVTLPKLKTVNPTLVRIQF